MSTANPETCAHVWLANSGQGGDPMFRPNRQMSTSPLMHVLCSGCNARTWFTEDQWFSMAEAQDSDASP